jgi:hypothetical protein
MLALVLQAVASDPVPSDNDVKAGWVAFWVVIALIVAVVFLLRSFTKQLKKVEKANDDGVYGEPPTTESEAPPASAQGER